MKFLKFSERCMFIFNILTSCEPDSVFDLLHSTIQVTNSTIQKQPSRGVLRKRCLKLCSKFKDNTDAEDGFH